MAHFYLKGIEYLAIVDRHSGMLSVHATAFKGSKEMLRILWLHCHRNEIPRDICTDGSLIFCFCLHETQDFFSRFHFKHRIGSVANAHLNLLGEFAIKNLKHILRDIVWGTGNLDSDAVTQALLSPANTPCKVLKKSPVQFAYGRSLTDFPPRNIESRLS